MSITASAENEQMDVLSDIQSWMQEALMYPRLADLGRTEAEVLPAARLSPAECLGIYQRSYYARLLNCMREQFPALCYALGESVFDEFSRAYLREAPSDSYTLHELGRRFPDYLRDTRPDRDLPPEQRESWVEFMIDLADFERQVFTMYDAVGDEDNLLDGVTPAGGDIEDKDLVLQRCLKIHRAKFPVARYYCLVRDEKAPELPPRLDSFVALVRINYRTRLVPLTELEYELVSAMQRLGDVPDALAELAGRAKAVGNIHEAWRASGGIRDRWLAGGFFVRRNRLCVFGQHDALE